MAEIDLEALADQRDMWLFNLELECSGASLWPLEEVVIGGAVLKMADLLKVLRRAEEAETELAALRARLMEGEGENA